MASTGQIHENRAEVGERCCGSHIQPIGDGCRVAKRTHPQAATHGVTHVVRCHGDEQHPGQGAPGVFEAGKRHEEAQRETENGDD